jgi:hypothetical protein
MAEAEHVWTENQLRWDFDSVTKEGGWSFVIWDDLGRVVRAELEVRSSCSMLSTLNS